MNETCRRKAEDLPDLPGVYIFKDEGGAPIYVGKAKSLRARGRSYFQEPATAYDTKRDRMLEAAQDLETIVVKNEKEAMALENNLIKQYQPRYNVLLRDDKTYPYIKLTLGERFPRVYVTRRLKKDGSIYFGPYFPASLAYRIVDLIHRTFRVPSCHVDLTFNHPRPCLQYFIHRCLGPCVEGLTTSERYAEAARQARWLLEGRVTHLIAELRKAMLGASEAQRFEEAARFRDQVRTLDQIRQRQVMAAASGEDMDVFGFHQEGSQLAINLFHFRGGRAVDRRELFFEDLETFDPSEFFSALLNQLYLDQPYLPTEVHVPVDFEDRETLAELLSDMAGRRVHILSPQRGRKRALLELAARNAWLSFQRRFRVSKPQARDVLKALAEALELAKPPQRIEAFDISHIQGKDTVASMVVWEDGKMKKSDYRKFIVKTVPQNDDFASMREVVGRRYRRLQQEKKPLPDLILVDGGVGQLHAAAEALEAAEIINQPLASIAKREEVLYIYGREHEPVELDHHSPALHLVQQIRDEAHRFAITFHRKRRGEKELTGALEEIPGVGEKTVRKLLEHFGSVRALRSLLPEELSQVVGQAQARRVWEHFKRS